MKVYLAVLMAVSVVACIAAGDSGVAAARQKKDSRVEDWSASIDAAKAAGATAVLRVRLVAVKGADKYEWDKVEILAVLKNESTQQFGASLEVAHYSWDKGIPKGESTIYLQPYSDAINHPWKLVDGTAQKGVSHVKPA